MCLIITGKSEDIRNTLLYTPKLLDDIYSGNSDGVGIMYANKHGLKVIKKLCRDIREMIAFISNMPDDDRNMAIHFRMKTHGDIDLFNCHPYSVVEGEVALMHNGILHTGNKADPSKSDTWHFIQDFLVDTVIEAPGVVHADGFRTMVGEFIGDNRFVFMDKHGTMSHVNYDQGIEHDNMWFSNTYAWTPSMLIPGYRPSYSYSSSRWGVNGGWSWEREGELQSGYPGSSYATKKEEEEDFYDWEAMPSFSESQILDAVTNWCDPEAVANMLEYRPYTVLNTLFVNRVPLHSSYVRGYEIPTEDAKIVEAVMKQQTNSLISMSMKDCGRVAEVLCYYIDWAIPVPDQSNTKQQQLELVVNNQLIAA